MKRHSFPDKIVILGVMAGGSVHLVKTPSHVGDTYLARRSGSCADSPTSPPSSASWEADCRFCNKNV